MKLTLLFVAVCFLAAAAYAFEDEEERDLGLSLREFEEMEMRGNGKRKACRKQVMGPLKDKIKEVKACVKKAGKTKENRKACRKQVFGDEEIAKIKASMKACMKGQKSADETRRWHHAGFHS